MTKQKDTPQEVALQARADKALGNRKDWKVLKKYSHYELSSSDISGLPLKNGVIITNGNDRKFIGMGELKKYLPHLSASPNDKPKDWLSEA